MWGGCPPNVGGGNLKGIKVTGEAADISWENNPPRPPNCSCGSLSTNILVPESSLNPIPAPDSCKKKKAKTKALSLQNVFCWQRWGRQQQVRFGQAAQGAGAPVAGGRQRGAVCAGGVKHSQNSSILPARVGAGAAALAAQVRGNTAP